MEKCKFAQKNRKFAAVLFFVCLVSVISVMVFPVWGNETAAQTKKKDTAESVLKSNDYITSVLYDRQIADKYGFYSTDYIEYLKEHEAVGIEEEEIKEIEDFAASLAQGAANDEEKLRSIYAWVVENIYYDHDFLEGRRKNNHSGLYEVFKERYSICAGYARLLRFMLLSQKIPAVHLNGGVIHEPNKWETERQSGHEWVMAYVDNHWVNLDPTWDSGNKYEYGQFKEKKKKWKYYKCSNKVMSEDHVISTVNGFHFDNINKTGLFYENGKYYYYVDGKIYNRIVRERDTFYTFISLYDPDGSIPYFDTEETIIEFRDENLLQALIDVDADRNGDGKISIREARTYFPAYRLFRKKMDLSGKKIRDLTGLSYFIDNIEYDIDKTLDLSNNEISDMSPLKEVRPNVLGLPYIDLSYNKISDLSTLPNAEIKRLRLDLSHNYVSDLSTLPDTVKAESLCLAYNKISDLRGVEKLKNVEDLDLSYNQISDTSLIVGMEGDTLDVSYNQIKDRKMIDDLDAQNHCSFYTKGNPFWAEDLKINRKNASLRVHKSIQLKARLDRKAAVQEVEWKSSNPKVAEVSSDGRVTAKKKGSAVITCSTIDGSNLEACCRIRVK